MKLIPSPPVAAVGVLSTLSVLPTVSDTRERGVRCYGEGEAAFKPTCVDMASSIPPFCQVCGVTRSPFAELWFTQKTL